MSHALDEALDRLARACASFAPSHSKSGIDLAKPISTASRTDSSKVEDTTPIGEVPPSRPILAQAASDPSTDRIGVWRRASIWLRKLLGR
jgi:hypothetical protein